MKDEALKLADELSQYTINDGVDDLNKRTIAMIRKLVEELDTTEKAYKWTEMARNAPTKPLSDEEILQAVARGWCSDKNSHKTMDSDLATAIAHEIKKAIEERHGIK